MTTENKTLGDTLREMGKFTDELQRRFAAIDKVGTVIHTSGKPAHRDEIRDAVQMSPDGWRQVSPGVYVREVE